MSVERPNRATDRNKLTAGKTWLKSYLIEQGIWFYSELELSQGREINLVESSFYYDNLQIFICTPTEYNEYDFVKYIHSRGERKEFSRQPVVKTPFTLEDFQQAIIKVVKEFPPLCKLPKPTTVTPTKPCEHAHKCPVCSTVF